MKRLATLVLLVSGLSAGLHAQWLSSTDSRAAFSPETPAPAKASEYDDYGGKLGIGISLFNGVGVPVRYYLSPKKVLEAGMYVGAIAIWEDGGNGPELIAYTPNFMLGAGYSYFGNRFLKEKKHKSKVRAHGVALRAQQLIGDFNTTFASLGWAMETFRKERKHNSFIFELGLQGVFPNFTYDGAKYDKARPGVYLRCHWNFFLD